MASIYSVSQVNSYIKNMFAQDFALSRIAVRGEVSNCKYHTSGHIYFTLKDGTGTLAAVMFAGQRRGLSFQLREGQQVVVTGCVDVYERDGKYQLYARGIELDGRGDLFERFQRLKDELEEIRMFAAEYKRPIPRYAMNIGVVTASTGAAIRDIMNITARRNPYVQLMLYPALVQGDGAVASIVAGIRALDALELDVLIVGRGGGSLEDLWAFNEEIVVRAVAACPVPVISAVGHETDTTLCDFAADMRAPTPSAAAELAVPELAALRDTVGDLLHAVDQAAAHTLLEKDRALARLEQRLSAREPLSYVREMTLRTQHLKERLAAALDKRLTLLSGRLSQAQEHLRAVGPQAVLGRGYTIALRKGQAVASASQAGGDMTLIFRDGRANVRVQSVWEGDPFANEEGKANL